MAGIVDTIAAVALPSELATFIIGSAARNEWTPSSDVDVWVIRPTDDTNTVSVVSALVTAAKPTCRIDVMSGTASRFINLAYEDCHIGMSFIDSVFCAGNTDRQNEMATVKATLLADVNWKNFFLRSLRRDCELMTVRNPAVVTGAPIKFVVGGRMFCDNAIAACLVTGQPVSDILTAAKAYYLSLRDTSNTITDDAVAQFTTTSNSVIAECTRLFGYNGVPSTWAQTEAMRQKVRDLCLLTIANTPTQSVSSAGIWQAMTESRTRFAAGFALVFALQDANKLDQFDTIWQSSQSTLFSTPQLSSIPAALAMIPTP